MSSVDTDAISESARDIQFRINQLIRDISQEHPSIRRAYLGELRRIKEDSDNILSHVLPRRSEFEYGEEEESSEPEDTDWNPSAAINRLFARTHQKEESNESEAN